MAKLYLVKSGRLVPIPRAVPRGTNLTSILKLLQTRPTPAQLAAGFRNPLQPDTVTKVQVVGGTATIDVDPIFQEQVPSPTEQELQAGQLVMTLTDRGPGIGRVRFTLTGRPLPVPLGDGSTPAGPDQSVSRDDYVSIVGKA